MFAPSAPSTTPEPAVGVPSLILVLISPPYTSSIDPGLVVPRPSTPLDAKTPVPGRVIVPERVMPLSVAPVILLPELRAAQLKFAMTWVPSAVVPLVSGQG